MTTDYGEAIAASNAERSDYFAEVHFGDTYPPGWGEPATGDDEPQTTREGLADRLKELREQRTEEYVHALDRAEQEVRDKVGTVRTLRLRLAFKDHGFEAFQRARTDDEALLMIRWALDAGWSMVTVQLSWTTYRWARIKREFERIYARATLPKSCHEERGGLPCLSVRNPDGTCPRAGSHDDPPLAPGGFRPGGTS